MMTTDRPVLEIRNLSVLFKVDRKIVPVVRNVDLALWPGRTLCLVGESGSGKSVTARAVMGLERASGGEVWFEGQNLLAANQAALRSIRGNRIAMIFQDAMTALHPVIPVCVQMMEVLKAHGFTDHALAWERCVDMLKRVGIPDPQGRMRKYTFELSGGQRQRVMIAMALLLEPRVLIADEPTTALDVTIQAQVLDLFREFQRDSNINTAVLFITHDMGVVADLADDVAVMYGGRIMEQGPYEQVYQHPGHPYTRGLLTSIPVLGDTQRAVHPIPGLPPDPKELGEGCPFGHVPEGGEARCPFREERCADSVPMYWPQKNHGVRCIHDHIPETVIVDGGKETPSRPHDELLVRIKELRVRFPKDIRAVDGVDLDITRGTTVGLVGESGCGKSTLGRAILRINDRAYEEGSIYLGKHDLCACPPGALRPFRRRMQMIFQDPRSSLNSRMTIFDCIAEPLRVHRVCRAKDELHDRVERLMELVGLHRGLKTHYPHEFSGGMQQRVGIARAIALEPALIVCDEPTSALDVSIQEQIIQLLMRLRDELGITYLFISHNIAAVEHIADFVAVMYLGKIVEFGTTKQVIGTPQHPYTQALLSAVLVPDPAEQRKRQRMRLEGDVPSPDNPPSGCVFHPRCPVAESRCRAEVPPLLTISTGRKVACHLVN